MRKVFLLCSGLVLVAILLAACGPKATPTEAAPPTPVVVTVVVTQAQDEAPADLATPTLAPINLAGPEMAVGSKFLYVDGSTLVAVPGGTSLMGRGGGTDNPQREVSLSDFWIYRTEVTNQQYAYCVGQGKCTPPYAQDNPSYLDPARVGDPVTGVDWQQSQDYCEFVHGRLPTEAEWEKTGSWDPINEIKNIYPWGDAAPSCALTNFNNCVGKTTNVTLYPQGQSPYEALDMSGNSYEWVADWYDPLFYRNGPAQNPIGPEFGDRRSIRSGSYKSSKDQMPAAVRFFDNPKTHSRDRGFRCVVEDPTYYAPICEMLAYHGLDASGNSSYGGDYLECPDPVIQHSSTCEGGAHSNVKVHVDSPSIISVITGLDGCNPATNTADETHACPFGVAVHVEATCSLDPPDPGPACPVGWELSPDGTQCLSEGGPGEACPDGYEYDPLLHCCSTTPGNGAQICAAGFHPYSGNCVADEYGLVPPDPADLVTFPEGTAVDGCGPGDNNPCDPRTDPTCKPGPCQPVTCTYPWAPNPDGCSCYCLYGPGECD